MKSGRGNVWSINYMNIDKKRKMMENSMKDKFVVSMF